MAPEMIGSDVFILTLFLLLFSCQFVQLFSFSGCGLVGKCKHSERSQENLNWESRGKDNEQCMERLGD